MKQSSPVAHAVNETPPERGTSHPPGDGRGETPLGDSPVLPSLVSRHVGARSVLAALGLLVGVEN